MIIQFATASDYEFIAAKDKHIVKALIKSKIDEQEIFILRGDENQEIGWMRFGYFWDNTPFMNMLWLDEEYRGRGYGKQVVHHWEELMREKGFNSVMTSTQSNEGAQHFYRKLGYKDVGCLVQEADPLEIILAKSL